MTDQPGRWWELAVYGAATGLALGAVASLWLDRYFLSAVVLSCRISGYGALAFLALSLSGVSLVRFAGWLRLRAPDAAFLGKHCGRSAALLSLVHGGVALAAYLDFDWVAVWRVTYLRSGASAATLLVVLLLTSSKRVNQQLDWRLFRPLHRLAYVAAALAIHHLLLSPFASRWWTLLLSGAFGALLSVRLIPSNSPTQAS